MSLSRVAVGLLTLGLFLGCQRRNDGSLNVVLVLVDTLRADHLGAYGYSRPTSPALDRLAAESVLFTTARSQSACTFPSVNSLITSRHPIDFLGQPERRIGIPEDIPSLPEILSAHGYRTVAVSASPIVRKTPTKFNPHGGYHRGFDIFDEDCHRESARCLNEKSSRYLDELQHAQPFFLYLHYYDPHAPYSPPVDYQRQFGSHYAGRKGFIRRGDPWTIQSRIYREKVPHRVTDEDVQHLVDLSTMTRSFGFQGTQRAVSDERFKLLHDTATGGFQLFDLRTDPGELRDVRDRHPRKFRRLRKVLFEWIDEHEDAARTREMTRQAEEQLRAVGYLE